MLDGGASRPAALAVGCAASGVSVVTLVRLVRPAEIAAAVLLNHEDVTIAYVPTKFIGGTSARGF